MTAPRSEPCAVSHYATLVETTQDVEVYQLGEVECADCLRRMAEKHEGLSRVFRARLARLANDTLPLAWSVSDLAQVAVERAVDAALGELARQTADGIDVNLLREARGAGIFGASVFLTEIKKLEAAR